MNNKINNQKKKIKKIMKFNKNKKIKNKNKIKWIRILIM